MTRTLREISISVGSVSLCDEVVSLSDDRSLIAVNMAANPS